MESVDQKSVTLVKTVGLLESAEGRFWTVSYSVYFTSVSTHTCVPVCIPGVWLLPFLISYRQSIPMNTAQLGACAAKPHTLSKSAV